jgi:hypothetical protein
MNLSSNSKEILVGITGKNVQELKEKIIEIEKFKIKKVSLFLTFLNPIEKKKIYELLFSSNIKEIPLVHLRNDMNKKEINLFVKKFNTKCFTIHESSFKYLKKWKGFKKKLFIEFNYDNKISKKVDVDKIGGFCIDLSHFKASEERQTKEYLYILKHKNNLFFGNHLNGYNPKTKRDMHFVNSIKNFDYLKTLPRFIFGKYIALEMFNQISEQLKYKKYLEKILKKIILPIYH